MTLHRLPIPPERNYDTDLGNAAFPYPFIKSKAVQEWRKRNEAQPDLQKTDNGRGRVFAEAFIPRRRTLPGSGVKWQAIGITGATAPVHHRRLHPAQKVRGNGPISAFDDSRLYIRPRRHTPRANAADGTHRPHRRLCPAPATPGCSQAAVPWQRPASS